MLNIIFKEIEQRESNEVLLVCGSANYKAMLEGEYLDLYGNTEFLGFYMDNKRLLIEKDEVFTYGELEGEYLIVLK